MAVSDRNKAVIVEWYSRGCTVSEIAKGLNLGYHQVYHVVNTYLKNNQNQS